MFVERVAELRAALVAPAVRADEVERIARERAAPGRVARSNRRDVDASQIFVVREREFDDVGSLLAGAHDEEVKVPVGARVLFDEEEARARDRLEQIGEVRLDGW